MEYVGRAKRKPGPYILHYGIDWKLEARGGGTDAGLTFNKLTYVELDPPSCPNWCARAVIVLRHTSRARASRSPHRISLTEIGRSGRPAQVLPSPSLLGSQRAQLP